MKPFSLLVLLLSFFSVMGLQLPSQDILALLEFKKGIKHDPTGYVLSSWNEDSVDFDGCPSSWNGVLCNGSDVTGVILDNLGLAADANLSVFSNLKKLVKLSMSNNSISGKLPDNIAEFKSLELLDVSNNLFSSSLPVGIRKLTSLQNMSLAGNNFSGQIPDSISGMASIQSLDLSCNSFSGPLPASLTKLTNLVLLNLSHNGFTGKIPQGFELILSLDKIDLHGNLLDGNLEDEFILISNASYIDFSENMLVSSYSQQQKSLPQISESIKYLNLSHNRLTGSLVSGREQADFAYLKVLDLSYNQLSGELPEFDFVYELKVLKLSNNRFSGFVPSCLLKGDSLVLTELDLSSNNLSGPVRIITSTTLHFLNLSSNGFTDELPLLTGSCAVLDLSNNKLEGNLSRMMKWGNIEFLDLSRNHLTGPIPEITPQFLRLNYLNLSHNFLSSSLPRVLTLYPKLKVLDISSNQLDGKFLVDLLRVPTLQEVHLENNMISGRINLSSFLPSSSDLQILEFSYNHFNGSFPEEFGSLTGLRVLNIAGNHFSGSLPITIANMSSLYSLDISENHFTGPLPINIPKGLKKFNASINDLSGVVPENLRKFPSSSFYPGNSKLHFPNGPSGSINKPDESSKRKPISSIVKVIIIIVSCVVVVLFMSVLLAIIIHYIRTSRFPSKYATSKDMSEHSQPHTTHPGRVKDSKSVLVISAEDFVTSQKGSSSEIISLDEQRAAVVGCSPSKNSHFSSPGSSDSISVGNHARLYARSPDKLIGELYFHDDAITLTHEELSRAPAEVLGRSSHGTSYKAKLENGLLLRVKWLRGGVAKQRKEFAKEAKKVANIRHPNVVGLRGYYWGPTQHEKLILSDYISPGSLAYFLYERPGRGPALTWALRLKIAVDVARGLNYLHFDRAVPHGNLKATNVLLDTGHLHARVADYCLHKLMTQAATFDQIMDAGVLGYRAPELGASKKPIPSFKSDVYAFGVILLELLTGRCAGDVVSHEKEGLELANWVRLLVAQGRGSECFDAELVQEMGNSVVKKGMNEVLGIAIECIRSVSERPGIKTVYEDLSSI